jgi:hypothetical protein
MGVQAVISYSDAVNRELNTRSKTTETEAYPKHDNCHEAKVSQMIGRGNACIGK